MTVDTLNGMGHSTHWVSGKFRQTAKIAGRQPCCATAFPHANVGLRAFRRAAATTIRVLTWHTVIIRTAAAAEEYWGHLTCQEGCWDPAAVIEPDPRKKSITFRFGRVCIKPGLATAAPVVILALERKNTKSLRANRTCANSASCRRTRNHDTRNG